MRHLCQIATRRLCDVRHNHPKFFMRVMESFREGHMPTGDLEAIGQDPRSAASTRRRCGSCASRGVRRSHPQAGFRSRRGSGQPAILASICASGPNATRIHWQRLMTTTRTPGSLILVSGETDKFDSKIHCFTGRRRKATDAAYTAASSRSSARLDASLSPSTKELICVQR
jgi:hypothetical protein